MKRLSLAVMMCFGYINVAYADFLGIGRFWEDVKRETTNVLQPVEKAVRKTGEDIGREGGKAWEDIKRETTKGLNSVTFSINANYRQEFKGDGKVETEFKINS
jgi:hypothetical protein